MTDYGESKACPRCGFVGEHTCLGAPPPNPFDEHTRMWEDDFTFRTEPIVVGRWPWQARLGARLSDFIDGYATHDRIADEPAWWRALDRLAGWLYTWGQR